MITDNDIHRFTCGDCHILARELNVRTGWPIHCFTYYGQPDIHAFVVAPDGRILDVEGFHKPRALVKRWKSYGARKYRPFDWKELLSQWGGSSLGKHSYRRAKVVADHLLEGIDLELSE